MLIRRTLLVALAVGPMLTLSACSSAVVASGTPTPHARSASPTPSSTPRALPAPEVVAAPASEEDARPAVRNAFIEYLAVADDAAAGTATPALIDRVASDAAAEILKARERLAPTMRSGHSAFAFVSWTGDTLTTSGTSIPYGKMTMTGCIDSSRVVRTATAANLPQLAEMTYEIDYSPSAQRWLVSSQLPAAATDCTAGVASDLSDVRGTAAAFATIESQMAAGSASARPTDPVISGLLHGKASDIVRTTPATELATEAKAGFEPRFMAWYSDTGMDVFGCPSSPPGAGDSWLLGLHYFDMTYDESATRNFYITDIRVDPTPECTY